MIKPLLQSFILIIAFIFFGCSAGKINISEIKQPASIKVTDYSIEFDKTFATDLTASGTLRIDKKGNFLILFDGHVSSLALICVDYTTGKQIWKATESVWRYYFKDGLLVMQYDKGIEMVEVATGKSIFKLDDCTIRWTHPEGSELADQILVVYKEKDAILDLKKMEILSNPIRGRFATFTKLKANGTKVVAGGFLPNEDYIGEAFISTDVVEDETGNQLILIWWLHDSTRKFGLTIYDHSNKKLKDHHWTIPISNYKDEWGKGFSGLPEPEKLEPSTFVIGNQFFLFENYTRYRWSWGQGNNRITCIDLKTLEMKYQIWGQGPEDKEFHTFLFFKDIILWSDGVMHFQMGDAKYNQFDIANGKVIDSLQHRYTLLENYTEGIMLGFNYERKLIKDDIYTNKVNIEAWDYKNNEYSKSFQFDFLDHFPYEPYVAEDGTIIFNYYDEKQRKNILYCCKVIPSIN